MAKSCCENKGAELAVLREKQSTVLKAVLLINAIMFVVEFAFGVLSRSSALKADSLDMLGDAVVYGFSLYVLYRSEKWRASAAFTKGLIVVAFAGFVLFDTTMKAFGNAVPVSETMGIIGATALAANGTCLLLLLKHRHDDLNMRSTFICSRNDIISNVGVLVAALAVSLTQSKWPDVIVGYVIAGLFFRSAWSIFSESFQAFKVAQAADEPLSP